MTTAVPAAARRTTPQSGQPARPARVQGGRAPAAGTEAAPADGVRAAPARAQASTTGLAVIGTAGLGVPGRRERKKHRTREDLIRAAARLFAERGFDQTTTEAIADAADVSQRTFFRHFPSKEAVLYGDQEELEDAFRAAILARPAREGPLEAVAAALRTPVDSFTAARERTLLQARLAATSPSVSAYSRAVVQRGLERAIVAALAERMQVDPGTDPRPEVIAGAAMSALRASLRQWAAGAGRDDLQELAAAALLSLRTGRRR